MVVTIPCSRCAAAPSPLLFRAFQHCSAHAISRGKHSRSATRTLARIPGSSPQQSSSVWASSLRSAGVLCTGGVVNSCITWKSALAPSAFKRKSASLDARPVVLHRAALAETGAGHFLVTRAKNWPTTRRCQSRTKARTGAKPGLFRLSTFPAHRHRKWISVHAQTRQGFSS
jgi:hypothetical protein